MRAVKFGGSSVADADRLRAAGALLAVLRAREPVTAVVSALAGVTDGLLAVATGALAGDAGWRERLRALGERHRATYHDLTGAVPRAFASEWAAVEGEAEALAVIHGSRGAPAQALAAARFSGWGERLAVGLLAAATEVAGALAFAVADAPILLADSERVDVAAEPSALATRAWLLPRLAFPVMRGAVPVLPGYIARDAEGRLTTLGRNGSDHSAAIIAAALGVSQLTIYSDVAGLYSADPRVVAQARLLPALSYDEAARVARLGAKALHPRAVEPLAAAAIPLELRDVAALDAPGTDIGPRERLARQRGRDAAWVVVARSAATPGAVEVSALRLPAWPAQDERDNWAAIALAAIQRLGLSPTPQRIAPDEARVTVAAADGAWVTRALHAALAEPGAVSAGSARLASGA